MRCYTDRMTTNITPRTRIVRAITRRLALAALPAVLAAFLLAPGTLHAATSTSLSGKIAGLELCPQEVCGAAIFMGRFDGALDGTADSGSWWVAIRHEDLPAAGARANITDGIWGMAVGDHALRGVITAGSILNNGDGTFVVTPQLDIREGGAGALSLSILLDHGPFPPLVQGNVASEGTPLPAPARTPTATGDAA